MKSFLLMSAAALLFTSCESKESTAGPKATEVPEEKVRSEDQKSPGEHLDHALEKTGEGLQVAGEKTEEGINTAAEKTGRFLQEVGEKLEDKAERTRDGE